MPELPGYEGAVAPAIPAIPVIKVTAITTRRDPILQTLVGPGEEHVSLAGIPTEASIYNALQTAMPGFVTEAYSHPTGGGKLLNVLKCAKRSPRDDGRARQAALVAFGVLSGLKHVVLVDEDVDLYDASEVLWAMTTQMQGDLDILTIPGVSGHPLDPSQGPDYNPRLSAKGTTAKTVFDATVPSRSGFGRDSSGPTSETSTPPRGSPGRARGMAPDERRGAPAAHRRGERGHGVRLQRCGPSRSCGRSGWRPIWW